MRQDLIKISLLLFVTIINTSCKEVFNPDDIISNQQIPVIQGNIQSGMPPEVKLTWAIPYEGNDVTFINDAQVWITDDVDTYETLENTAPGIYTPSNEDFVGIIGRSYTLHVEMSSGKLYESTPERINPLPEIDSLYAVPTKKTVATFTATGSFVTLEKEGMEINVSLSKETSATCFYRFKTVYVAQTFYILAPNSFNPINVYEWNSDVLDEFYSVDYSVSNNVKQIAKYNAGFFEFRYDSYLSDNSSTAPFTNTWIVTMHIYSVSSNVYQYYHSIGAQLGANDEIFATVPSQVKGNIRCLSDENETVIGIFEAASETISYMAFKWINLYLYRKLELGYYPEVGSGLQQTVPPDFWIVL